MYKFGWAHIAPKDMVVLNDHLKVQFQNSQFLEVEWAESRICALYGKKGEYI